MLIRCCRVHFSTEKKICSKKAVLENISLVIVVVVNNRLACYSAL